jgi:branched-chain amino acid transport system substrate-binding protein
MADGQVVCAEAGGVEGESKKSMDTFKAKFKEKYKVDVQIYAPYVYDAVNVLVAAMVKAGSAEPAKYLPVLAKTEGYKGVTGTIAFDNKGDIKNGALTLFTYKGGSRDQIAVVR